MADLICIVCPKGCHLHVDEDTLKVTGNECMRGEIYAQSELTNPVRVVTSTVRITGAEIPRLPVKTDGDIPKKDIFAAMKLLDNIKVEAPVKKGDIIVANILGGAVNFVATRSLPVWKPKN